MHSITLCPKGVCVCVCVCVCVLSPDFWCTDGSVLFHYTSPEHQPSSEEEQNLASPEREILIHTHSLRVTINARLCKR